MEKRWLHKEEKVRKKRLYGAEMVISEKTTQIFDAM